MLKRLFGATEGASASSGSSGGAGTSNAGRQSAIETLANLKETLAMLEKRESLLWRKAQEELGKAKQYTAEKNKRAALQCLKKKKMYETQADQIANNQLRVHDQVMLLEGSQATAQTVQALRSGAHAMKEVQKMTNIDNVEQVMDEINEHTDNMRAVNDALAEPFGISADFDEAELDAELNELEALELDQALLQPVAPAMPAMPHAMPSMAMPSVPSGPPVAARPTKTAEELELEALEAEMALA